MTAKEYSKKIREIQKALDRFPEIVAEKQRAYKARQKFLKETFGDLIKEVRRLKRKRLKDEK